jgi:cell division protein FtsB
MLNLRKSLLLISAMLEKENKPTLAHDVESAVERIAELEKERDELKRRIKPLESIEAIDDLLGINASKEQVK